jgi:hypothetical protein
MRKSAPANPWIKKYQLSSWSGDFHRHVVFTWIVKKFHAIWNVSLPPPDPILIRWNPRHTSLHGTEFSFQSRLSDKCSRNILFVEEYGTSWSRHAQGFYTDAVQLRHNFTPNSSRFHSNIILPHTLRLFPRGFLYQAVTYGPAPIFLKIHCNITHIHLSPLRGLLSCGFQKFSFHALLIILKPVTCLSHLYLLKRQNT